MRLFVGIPVEGELQAAVAALLKGFRSQLPACRWTPPENLHFTLRFLGDLAETNFSKVTEWFDACVAGSQPGQLELGQPGWFDRRDQTVFWLGLREPEWLKTLAQRFTAPVLNVPLEARDFVPHLTIGRLRRGACSHRRLATFLKSYQCANVPDALQTVTRVVLFESRLTGEGAIYQELRSFQPQQTRLRPAART